ncbi:MAG: rhodanese-like domain-containing protein [Alphaproteobacteria bacterium]|nr:rhodanese-like domain-containing protein [Alphaproteobacteria bacterium]
MQNYFFVALAVLAFIYFLFVRIIPAIRHNVYGKNVNFIDPIELDKMFSDEKELLVIDIRSESEFYNLFGHIDHAINLPYNKFVLRFNEISDNLTDFKDVSIVIVGLQEEKNIYKAYNLLKEKGLEKIFILNKGMSGWLRAQLPTVERNVKKI